MNTTPLTRLVFAAVALLVWVGKNAAQVEWRWEQGPWSAAKPIAFAVAYERGTSTEPTAIWAVMGEGEGSGLYRSTNDGARWDYVGLPVAGRASCIAVDPSDGNIVYVGVPGVGVVKTTDGGQTWFTASTGLENVDITRLAVSPHNPQLVLAGMKRGDGGQKVLWQTNNGGAEWEFNVGFRDIGISITDIVFDPVSSFYLYVSGNEGPADTIGVWKSEDGGDTWRRVVQGMTDKKIGAIAIDPVNTTRLYAGSSEVGHIYYSWDGAESWTQGYAVESGSINDVSVDAANGTTYAATVSKLNGLPHSQAEGILASVDGGESWEERNTNTFDRQVFSVVSDPVREGVVLAGTWSSAYISTEGGWSWQAANTGLRRVYTLSSAVTDYDGTHYLLTVNHRDHGALDHGSLARKRGAPLASSWEIVHQEDTDGGGFVAGDAFISPTNPAIWLAGGQGAERGDARGNPLILRSTDLGATWEDVYSEVAPARVVRRFAQSPEDIVYAVASKVGVAQPVALRSTDQGGTWTLAGYLDESDHVEVEDLAIDSTSGVLYAAGEYLKVRKSTDQGETWFSVGPFSDASAVGTDPTTSGVVYVFAPGEGMFKTTDGGQDWFEINEGLPLPIGRRFASIVVHPQTPSVVYLACGEWSLSSFGSFLYRTTNGGEWWDSIRFGDFPSTNVHRYTLDPTFYNRLYAASGDGVYSVPHLWTGELAVDATWRAGQTYLAEGTLTVPQGVRLTIEPGTIVRFAGAGRLRVHGELVAEGTEPQPIRFEPMDASPSGRWYGIIISNPRQSVLAHCRISGAQYGIAYLSTAHDEDVRLTDSQIKDCDIGIYLYGPYQYSDETGITRTTVIGSQYGVVTWGDDYMHGVRLEANVIKDGNSTGLWVARSRPVLYHNRIWKAGHTGVRTTDHAAPEFGINRRDTRPGFNTVANHELVQLRAESFSRPFLGLVGDDHRCNLLAGGMNRLYHDRDDVLRVWARGKGTVVQADRTFWGYPVLDEWFETEGEAEIIRRCPLKPDEAPETALLLQAAAHRAEGEFEEAILAYKTIIELYPDSPEAVIAMAALSDVYADLEKETQDTTVNQQKIAYLQEKAETHPDEMVKISAILQLARDYELKGEYAEAQARYEEVLQATQSAEVRAIAYRALVNLHAAFLSDLATARNWLDEMAISIADNDHVLITKLDLALFTGEMVPLQGMGKTSLAGGRLRDNIPTRYSLEQNFPNPFNPTTEIWFKLGAAGYITLKLYDLLGREVRTLAEGEYESGYHNVTLHASGLASGVYFYRLSAPGFTQVRKLLLMK